MAQGTAESWLNDKSKLSRSKRPPKLVCVKSLILQWERLSDFNPSYDVKDHEMSWFSRKHLPEDDLKEIPIKSNVLSTLLQLSIIHWLHSSESMIYIVIISVFLIAWHDDVTLPVVAQLWDSLCPWVSFIRTVSTNHHILHCHCSLVWSPFNNQGQW